MVAFGPDYDSAFRIQRQQMLADQQSTQTLQWTNSDLSTLTGETISTATISTATLGARPHVLYTDRRNFYSGDGSHEEWMDDSEPKLNTVELLKKETRNFINETS